MDLELDNDIERFIEYVETSLDNYIDTGTEDELFISGYLHGHFSLAASRALQQPNTDIVMLNTMLTESLENAFANNELEHEYQLKVYSMWNELADIATKG